MDRRGFFLACASLAASACGKASPPLPPGRLLATRHDLGHRREFPAPGETRRIPVAIVGAGIGGLSAAWRLTLAGLRDFELFELEAEGGGNSRWGENEVSAFPWGAHYLPLPTRESRATRLLLGQLGVIQGDPQAAAPRYDERALCAAPQERLYRLGSWSEGLAPLAGVPDAERQAWQRFQERMAQFKAQRGRDGRRAFAIPLELSSRDPELIALDRLTMAEWLAAEGLDAPAVRWAVDYACRDDYGCSHRDVSAWAGIHYFASRDAAGANADADTVLTWPEGNGWLVRRLLELVRPPLTKDALVYRVAQDRRGATLEVYLAAEERSVRIRAEHVIWAAPLRFAFHALNEKFPALLEFDHAPWVVANLTLSDLPAERHGAPLAWDNVIHDSESLGYVVATHQKTSAPRGPSVLTWYRPLAELAPAQGRARLLAATQPQWAETILAELARPHPEIRELAQRLDVLANGHAMVRPRPGLIWGAARARVLRHAGRVHFAHADASGISVFEEAQYRGVAAAERVLARLGARPASIL